MIDLQSIMNMVSSSTDLSSSNNNSTKSYNNESSSFSKVIEKATNAVDSNEKVDVNELKEFVESVVASGSKENIFSALLGLDSDEEIDYEALMALFADANINTNFINIENVAQVVEVISQVGAEIATATGIDVSQLTKVDTNETFILNTGANTEALVENTDVNFEFSAITSTETDFEQQLDLFTSFSDKSIDIRNVADEGDSEFEVLNVALGQNVETAGATIIETPTIQTPQNPEVYGQIKTAIVENAQTLEVGNNEFTMVLNPESLGEVTVKLINQGGQATLEILAASATATKLINEDLNILRDVFRPMQIEVKNAEIVVVETQEAQMQNFDMNNQNFDRNNQHFNDEGFVSYGNNNQTEDEVSKENEQISDPDNLSIYI